MDNLKKPKRIENKDLLENLRQFPCFFCNKPPPSEVHHITTRGAGGGDTEDNCIPLCRRCHKMWHDEGLSKIVWKYPKIKEWLLLKNRYDVLRKL